MLHAFITTVLHGFAYKYTHGEGISTSLSAHTGIKHVISQTLLHVSKSPFEKPQEVAVLNLLIPLYSSL